MFLLIVIIVLISAYILLGMCLPSSITLSNHLNMLGNLKVIYERIEDFNHWSDWAIWNEDNSMEITIPKPAKGVSAQYIWKSKIKEIKHGSLTLINSSADHFLIYEFCYDKLKRGELFFDLEAKEAGTFVKCSITIQNKRKIFSRYFLYFNRKSIIYNIHEFLLKIDRGI